MGLHRGVGSFSTFWERRMVECKRGREELRVEGWIALSVRAVHVRVYRG